MQIILFILPAILLLTALFGYFYFRQHLRFNSSILNTISTLKNQPIPNLVTGITGFAYNGDVKIHYERIKSKTPNGECVVMLHGLTQTMLALPNHFIQPFLNNGYDVVRLDLRDSGLSTWISDWQNHKYSLEDMAEDVIAVVNELGIDNFHIIGKSMGGMIAQTVAIRHSERIKSLTSIMSSPFFHNPDLVQVPAKFKLHFALVFLAYHKGLRNLTDKLKFHLAIEHILTGPERGTVDNQLVIEKALYDIKQRNGYNKHAQKQHGYAIKKSGSRIEALQQLNIPTLVVHGTADPLVKFEHGIKTANTIPKAETLFIKNMGHRLPKVYAAHVTEKVIQFLKTHKKEYVYLD